MLRSCPDPDNSNNSANTPTLVQTRADLGIVQVTPFDQYKASSVVTYTVTVTNDGPSDAKAVIVTDNLPEVKQAIYQSDTGGCTKNGNALTCALGDMPVGTSKSFNVSVLIKGNKGQVANTVSVTSSTVDPAFGNNTFTKVVIIGK